MGSWDGEEREGLMDPNEGDVRFENEGYLEPLPVVLERTVVLRAAGLTKTYAAVTGGAERGELELFRELDLKVHAGEMVAIVGESGAGRVRCCICWLPWISRRRARCGAESKD